MPKIFSYEFKLEVLRYLDEKNVLMTDVARHFKITTQTIYNWRKLVQYSGTVEVLDFTVRFPLCTLALKLEIINYWRKYPTVTQRELGAKFKVSQELVGVLIRTWKAQRLKGIVESRPFEESIIKRILKANAMVRD